MQLYSYVQLEGAHYIQEVWEVYGANKAAS